MLKRIQKGGAIPSINPIVDLNNLISVRYFLPMGSHDIDALTGECSIRLSSEGDIFLPLGDTTEEVLPAGELVYADAQRIRTRRWIWRQSEIGKITQESKTIFFPIDGFLSVNETSVRAAQEDLAELLQQFFDCKIHLDFIDKSHPSTTILP
jgi:DNA/RNA-binding domain of Phe-tRNA-synthetase-like protein